MKTESRLYEREIERHRGGHRAEQRSATAPSKRADENRQEIKNVEIGDLNYRSRGETKRRDDDHHEVGREIWMSVCGDSQPVANLSVLRGLQPSLSVQL